MINGDHKLPDNVLCMSAVDIKVCIDVKSVLKVIMLPYLEHSPMKNIAGLVGMLNYSGQNINVMDLYALLTGNRDTAYTLNNAVVITGNDDLMSGLIIDEVYGVKQLDTNKIKLADGLKEKETLVIGSIIFDDETYSLLIPDIYKPEHTLSKQ